MQKSAYLCMSSIVYVYWKKWSSLLQNIDKQNSFAYVILMPNSKPLFKLSTTSSLIWTLPWTLFLLWTLPWLIQHQFVLLSQPICAYCPLITSLPPHVNSEWSGSNKNYTSPRESSHYLILLSPLFFPVRA